MNGQGCKGWSIATPLAEGNELESIWGHRRGRFVLLSCRGFCLWSSFISPRLRWTHSPTQRIPHFMPFSVILWTSPPSPLFISPLRLSRLPLTCRSFRLFPRRIRDYVTFDDNVTKLVYHLLKTEFDMPNGNHFFFKAVLNKSANGTMMMPRISHFFIVQATGYEWGYGRRNYGRWTDRPSSVASAPIRNEPFHNEWLLSHLINWGVGVMAISSGLNHIPMQKGCPASQHPRTPKTTSVLWLVEYFSVLKFDRLRLHFIGNLFVLKTRRWGRNQTLVFIFTFDEFGGQAIFERGRFKDVKVYLNINLCLVLFTFLLWMF